MMVLTTVSTDNVPIKAFKQIVYLGGEDEYSFYRPLVVSKKPGFRTNSL